MKYVIVVNSPGYLPENDPDVYTNKRDAIMGFNWIKRDYKEGGWKVDGFYPFATMSFEGQDLVIDVQEYTNEEWSKMNAED